jgi:hypothetical protein
MPPRETPFRLSRSSVFRIFAVAQRKGAFAMSMTLRTALLFVGAAFSLGALAQPAPADEPGSYDQSDQADPPSRVARLAYLRGAVSFVPAGENDWVEAQLNRPLFSGD